MEDDLTEPVIKMINLLRKVVPGLKAQTSAHSKENYCRASLLYLMHWEGKITKLILLLQYFYLVYLLFSKSQLLAIPICKLLKWKAFKSVDWKRSKYHICIEEA